MPCSLAYVEQTSANRVYFRSSEYKKKIPCISSLTSKTVLDAKIQGWMLCQDTAAFYGLAESQINQAAHPPSPFTHPFPNYKETLTVAPLSVTGRGTIFCGLISLM